MSRIHLHFGCSNYTRNRLQKLTDQLRDVEPNVRTVRSQFVHILSLARSLTVSETGLVTKLLDYGTLMTEAAEGEPSCLVVPRLGTISPWSSKATDVFHLCKLNVVLRVERATLWSIEPWSDRYLPYLHDRMTESVIDLESVDRIFREPERKPLVHVDLGSKKEAALLAVSDELGLALSSEEIAYLAGVYEQLRRDPTDVELMMFAQANSEHCRHKTFNARWDIDRIQVNDSLFSKIRSTSDATDFHGLISAYQDNAAVIEGLAESRFGVNASERIYEDSETPVDILMKVETHNHPTAISPFPGAATGSGGEIRDEGAVGRGSKPKAGLVGYTTSHLRVPGLPQPWENELSTPDRLAPALEIMLDGPIGAARYNNEFGRPALTGYFRTFESHHGHEQSYVWGYHKPVMIAGGVGSVLRNHVHPTRASEATRLIVLGGPAMLIGLGGGAASSVGSGAFSADLDFASVQRDNAELQRRCQEVIDRCTAMGAANPILCVHDVGAGGLSNALPELINELGSGGRIDLAAVPNLDRGMSPMEIWCNEAQERYVLAISASKLNVFGEICQRERCPYADVGQLTDDRQLIVEDTTRNEFAVNLDLSVLFGEPPLMHRKFNSVRRLATQSLDSSTTLADAIERVLDFPTVASKKFLITIGDRSISGFVVRDQMVGPFQVPVADAAITASDFDSFRGECMAIGERSPVAVVDPAASARLAIAEALTNLMSVRCRDSRDVVLSANWMAAIGKESQDQALYEAVTAATDLCIELGIPIPVGKDSLSMSTEWTSDGVRRTVVSPVTLIASAFAPVPDVREALTPQIQSIHSSLVLVELNDNARLGCSSYAQVFGGLGQEVPDIDDAEQLKNLFNFVMQVHDQKLALSMHDRSDGGVVTTILEMAFAGQVGLEIVAGTDPTSLLFNEEPGLVFEVLPHQIDMFSTLCEKKNLHQRIIAEVTPNPQIVIRTDRIVYRNSLTALQTIWSRTSHAMQRLRDDSDCADEELSLIGSPVARLRERLSFAAEPSLELNRLPRSSEPKVAVLRDQGVNGHTEMAAAFHRAGFCAVDVHMTDLFDRRTSLDDFDVLAACGGFSYGDVLGAGGGWAKSILFNDRLREEFLRFFHRQTLVLGVCNGCQMLSQLKQLIPDADHWPSFEINRSEQFEARVVQLRIENVASAWLEDMQGSQIPAPIAHGEGNATFESETARNDLDASNQIALRYVDGEGNKTQMYPLNPNGSHDSVAGVLASQGRVLALMPHPERVFRTVLNSWIDPIHTYREDGPWMKLFRNARENV